MWGFVIEKKFKKVLWNQLMSFQIERLHGMTQSSFLNVTEWKFHFTFKVFLKCPGFVPCLGRDSMPPEHLPCPGQPEACRGRGPVYYLPVYADPANKNWGRGHLMEAVVLWVVLCSKSCFRHMCAAETLFLPLKWHVKKKNQVLLLLNWQRIYFMHNFPCFLGRKECTSFISASFLSTNVSHLEISAG